MAGRKEGDYSADTSAAAETATNDCHGLQPATTTTISSSTSCVVLSVLLCLFFSSISLPWSESAVAAVCKQALLCPHAHTHTGSVCFSVCRNTTTATQRQQQRRRRRLQLKRTVCFLPLDCYHSISHWPAWECSLLLLSSVSVVETFISFAVPAISSGQLFLQRQVRRSICPLL